MRALSGGAIVAGVVGRPVRQSLSPLLHGAWIEAAGLDAAYVPFPVPRDRFAAFVEGLRGGVVAGLNVTLPFKAEALRLADRADDAATRAGAANLLLFGADGTISAANTDGTGLLAALGEQAPGWSADAGPAVVLGAGGAARGAAAALRVAGAAVRLVNRTFDRASDIAGDIDGVEVFPWEALAVAFADAGVVINATTAGLEGEGALDLPWASLPPQAVAMDMVYKPLRTPFLRDGAERGHAGVDGLAMLIGQARPSFRAIFGIDPPAVDVRALALRALGEGPQG